MSNLLSQLTKSEQARLLEEMNYMNLEEIHGFCSERGIPFRIVAEHPNGKVRATKDTDRKPIVLAPCPPLPYDRRRRPADPHPGDDRPRGRSAGTASVRASVDEDQGRAAENADARVCLPDRSPASARRRRLEGFAQGKGKVRAEDPGANRTCACLTPPA